MTFERLRNPEPQNWLMDHHDYNSQRYSALDIINKSNVKISSSPLRSRSAALRQRIFEATPLVDDGFMYITDSGAWSTRSTCATAAGRVVWKMDPGQQKPDRNRGVAFWDNLVFRHRPGRTRDRDRSRHRQIVWDRKLGDQPDLEFTAAPLALKDAIRGASGGDNGVRNWLAGSIRRPHSGRPSSSRRPASPAARPGRTRPTPGRPAAARSMSPAPTIRRPTSPIGAPATPCPATLRVPSRRQPVHRHHGCLRRGNGQNGVVFPAHAERQPRLRFRRLPDHHRRQGQRRRPETPPARQPQRLQLHLRSHQRPVPQRGPICRQSHLDQGHRPEDRQARRLRSRQGRATFNHDWKGGTDILKAPAPTCMAAPISGRLVQSEDQTPLHRRQRGLRQHHAGPHRTCARQVHRRRLRQRGPHHLSPPHRGRSGLGPGQDAQGRALRQPLRHPHHRRRHRGDRTPRRHDPGV